MSAKQTQHLETAFAQTINTLTSRSYAVLHQDRAGAPPLHDPIIWQQTFSAVDGPSFWMVAGRELWESVGTQILLAAGLDEATEEDCRSTWQEIVNQTMGSLASRLGSDIQREVTAGPGQAIQTEPEHLSWEYFSVAEEGGKPLTFKCAWTGELAEPPTSPVWKRREARPQKTPEFRKHSIFCSTFRCL